MSKIKMVNKIKETGFPTSSKNYLSAHEQANKAEKKKFPKGYEVLKKEVRKVAKKHDPLATNTKTGEIKVEKKYKKYKNELTFHEKTENKILRKKK
jgi:hypothetical protein